jgi:hypothetical protein
MLWRFGCMLVTGVRCSRAALRFRLFDSGRMVTHARPEGVRSVSHLNIVLTPLSLADGMCSHDVPQRNSQVHPY